MNVLRAVFPIACAAPGAPPIMITLARAAIRAGLPLRLEEI